MSGYSASQKTRYIVKLFCDWVDNKAIFSIPGDTLLYMHVILQGGAVNRGLKRFFSLYRPSCHIEAYIRPEKYCFVWAGPLANHHSILTSFFLATAEQRQRKKRYALRIWTAAFRSHSAATDGHRAAKLA
jgi:hypothetical protein